MRVAVQGVMAALTVLAAAAQAQDWREVRHVPGSHRIFVDADTIGMQDGYRTAFFRLDYEQEQALLSEPHRQETMLISFNCQGSMLIRKGEFISSDGRVIQTMRFGSSADDWMEVGSQAGMQAMESFVCSRPTP